MTIYYHYHLVFPITLEESMVMINLHLLKRKKDYLIVDLEKKRLRRDHRLICLKSLSANKYRIAYFYIMDNLDLHRLPQHIAIIMDGNGRWAQEQGQDRLYGHYHGVISVRKVVEAAAEIGIKYLTMYAFSTENWDRPTEEVKNGQLNPAQIDEAIFAQNLTTKGIPDPELMIRTSGEHRISNFLLYQLAYAELYFTETRWPDFRKEHLVEAILDYQSRERRFGKTSAQIQSNE